MSKLKNNPNSPYLELMKRVLIDYQSIGSQEVQPLEDLRPTLKRRFLRPIDQVLRSRNYMVGKLRPVHREARMKGEDWPANAMTLVGYIRLSHLEQCIRAIEHDGISGDFLEAGVWRGGASMFMKAVAKELGMDDRRLWLADSFLGVPPPKDEYTEDRASELHKEPWLAVSKEEVKRNFQAYDVWDEKIMFIEGWYHESLPSCHVETLALLRIDCDLYESTHLALTYLYPKVSPGGFVIIDDYHAFDFCRKAVDEFRADQGITDELIPIDNEAIFWRKTT